MSIKTYSKVSQFFAVASLFFFARYIHNNILTIGYLVVSVSQLKLRPTVSNGIYKHIYINDETLALESFNPLIANPTKWYIDHFVGLAFKGLRKSEHGLQILDIEFCNLYC